MTFDYKGYGRIFVEKEEDIQRVKDKIKEIDDFEYGYLPNDLICIWQGNLEDLTYTYKFDELDIDYLCERLQEEGINAAWVTGKEAEWGYYHDQLTPSQAKLMYNAGFMNKNEILEEYRLDSLED